LFLDQTIYADDGPNDAAERHDALLYDDSAA